ncbi:Crp/Fnr family transcriptional regulator [Pollutibacter soli]|uniref:Crp/Fnr family transcriptional regulator n=1 Tax=Pollutibacter soli TaxID=3034157 RepID=UPI003013A17B
MKIEGLESSVDLLLSHFVSLISLDQAEKDIVVASFHPRLFRKKQYLLQEGDICTHLYFVVRGCLRMYKIDDKGLVHILQFAAENSWISDLGSFYAESPSELTIDTLEDSVVLQISRTDLINLYTSAPKFHRIFRVLVENSFVSLQKRLLQTISSTAEDRYQYFVSTYPNLTNRLPQTQIASYLGITPEFLSRLRNRQTKKS